MAREFKESAHLNTDKEKFDEGYQRIFGEQKIKYKNKKERKCFKCEVITKKYKMLHGMFYYCESCLEKM